MELLIFAVSVTVVVSFFSLLCGSFFSLLCNYRVFMSRNDLVEQLTAFRNMCVSATILISLLLFAFLLALVDLALR